MTQSNPKRRSPNSVMRLKRMGHAHPSRLSFMRTLLRRLKQEQWQFDRPIWQIDEQGIGHAVYQAKGLTHTYSLIAFAHDLPDELRSDRVIAKAWDATFTLFDGIPTPADIQRLSQNVPKQEAGRITHTELTLSRANRSVRLFNAVVDALASGKQPERKQLEDIGYLMRTTAVYGSGKFGAADFEFIKARPELAGPFRAEMLTVWLIRTFTVDLVEHMAKVKGNQQAITLDPSLRRCIGVGNSTGLGMAPFLMNHPTLLNNWIIAREEALARVLSLEHVTPAALSTFKRFVARASINASQWRSQHPIQQPKIIDLQNDLTKLVQHLATFDHTLNPDSGNASSQSANDKTSFFWRELYSWCETHLSIEGQEQVAMLMLEPYPELVDGLTECMDANEPLFIIDGSLSIQTMQNLLNQHYDWALAIDFKEQPSRSRFWYVSEEKLEPRLGERFDEDGAELEQPLGIAWSIRQLFDALSQYQPNQTLSTFLAEQPEYRHTVRRAQLAVQHPYMEIRDNLIAADMLPIDLLRLKLSFFGATRFDPRSDRWVRITMFQHAPFPHELADMPLDDWAYPPLPQTLLQGDS